MEKYFHKDITSLTGEVTRVDLGKQYQLATGDATSLPILRRLK